MPIYAYRCASCGHAQDVLQKMSDPVLTVCPACGASTFTKQLTAAGFQLKGSGWYVTDFRGGNSGAPAKPEGDAKVGEQAADKAADKPAADAAKPADAAAPKVVDKTAAKSADKTASSAAPPAPSKPAPSTGST